MRCNSSTEPNSITILPLRLPTLTVTRVSKAPDNCSATSCRPGIWIGLRRGGAGWLESLRLASVTASSVARTESPSATIRTARFSCVLRDHRQETTAPAELNIFTQSLAASATVQFLPGIRTIAPVYSLATLLTYFKSLG